MATLILSATSEITCEALPEDPYGHYKNENCTARNATYDETCELECDDGYESSGDIDVLTCEQDGTWSSGAYCVGEKRKKYLPVCNIFYDNMKPPVCL